jgi:alpha-tubulin suppressor-like RCC1 family protein
MGQLGIGSFAASQMPAAVRGPDGEAPFDGVLAVSAGTHHTLAIRGDGTLWAWGNNTFGQLGNGQWGLDAHSAVPVQVLGPDGEGVFTGAVAVAGGWDHSVALREDGTVWTWGSACHGQLGDGAADSNRVSTHPVQVLSPGGEGVFDCVRAVTCGAHHTVALREDGTVWTWGGGWEGQLGTGAVAGRRHQRLAGSRFFWTPPAEGRWTVALGYTYTDPDHLDAADRIELTDAYKGAEVLVRAELPQQVDQRTAHTSRNREFVEAVSTLRYPSAAQVGQQVLLVLEEVRFGQQVDNDYAENTHLVLTNEVTGQIVKLYHHTATALPAQVTGVGGKGRLSGVKAVAAGIFHAVALLDDGQAVAWGYNGGGQLGEGTREGFWEGNSSVRHLPAPVHVVGLNRKGTLDGIAAVAAGYEASWALMQDGTMRGWGWNVYGELGSGLRLGINRDHPQVVRTDAGDDAPPLGRIVEFAGGARHALARDEDGRIWAWGHNGFGQLATGDLMDRTFPVEVPALTDHAAEQPGPPQPGSPQPGPAAATWKRALHFELPQDARVLNVREFGALGNGVHLDMPAIQSAIDAAHEAGGGIVLLPPGTYRTGSVELKSGVNLHLQEGAAILGSTNRDHYRFPGLIYADGAHDIAITGPGVIDGQGQAFPSRGWRVQVFYLQECNGVDVCDVTTQNSGSWTQHYIRCRNLNIRGTTVNSPRPGRNNDGIDLSGCKDVLIEDCLVISDDDAIVIKSQSADRANRNYRVLNNRVLTYRGAFKLGTETRGSFSNLVVRNLEGWGAKALEIYSVDGTEMENIDIEGVRMHDALAAVLIRLGARLRPGYFGPDEDRVPGFLRQVRIKDVHVELSDKSYREILLEHGVENAGVADCHRYEPRESFISGLPEHPVEAVLLEDVAISSPGGVHTVRAAGTVPERPEAYPASYMFGRLPAWGLYMRHANGITLRNLTLEPQEPDARPPLVDENVRNLRTEGILVREASERQ